MSALDEDRFEFYGTQGELVVDRLLSTSIEFTDVSRKMVRAKRFGYALQALVSRPPLIEKFLALGAEQSYRAALIQFANAIRGKQTSIPDFDDGYQSLTITESAEESSGIGSLAECCHENLAC